MATPLTPEQEKFAARFPHTRQWLEVQAEHWEQLVQAVRNRYPERDWDLALRAVTIRGFESEQKCMSIVATQRAFVRGHL